MLIYISTMHEHIVWTFSQTLSVFHLFNTNNSNRCEIVPQGTCATQIMLRIFFFTYLLAACTSSSSPVLILELLVYLLGGFLVSYAFWILISHLQIFFPFCESFLHSVDFFARWKLYFGFAYAFGVICKISWPKLELYKHYTMFFFSTSQ